MSRIAIIGGHGKVALELIPRLVATGHSVGAFFRNPDHVSDVAQAGAQPIVFDIEHASTEEIAAQLKGYDAVVWSAGAGGGNAERTYAVDRDAAIRSMDAATQARVVRYIMVSYIKAGLDKVEAGNGFHAYAQAKADADAYLRGTPLRWTILGPGSLTLEPATGSINVVADDFAGPTTTSRANVAVVIHRALESDASVGETLRFTDGSTPVTDAL
jgi:putative NADH-flavin reductase